MRLWSFENNVGLSEGVSKWVKYFIIFFSLLTKDHLLVINENIKLLEDMEHYMMILLIDKLLIRQFKFYLNLNEYSQQ